MRRLKKRYYALGGVAIAVVALVLLWDWDWFIPIAQSQASSAIGRKVTIQHLHVELSRRPVVTVEGVVIANPDGFPADPPFLSADRLQAQLDIPAYLHDRSIVLPFIAADHPVALAQALPDGRNNWTFDTGAPSGGESKNAAPSSSPKIGDLRITDGHAHVVVPSFKSDFELAIATQAADQSLADAPVKNAQPAALKKEAEAAQSAESAVSGSRIVVEAKGTYAGQPITGHFVGGALLSLRDAAHPYPVDLQVANGPTQVSLVGTVQDPLAFAGANLKLRFAGPDLALLYPLTGVPIPQTPSYELTGQLAYGDGRIKFQDFAGRVGSSDLNGEIDVEPGRERRKVTADLHSRKVDLADLGGFIGSTPGRKDTPGQTTAQRQQVARAEASPQLIPNTPINLPKIRVADVDLKYRGDHIIGRSVPLDNLIVAMTIDDGKIGLHPVSFGVGGGSIKGNIDLDGSNDTVHARADIDFNRVELARLMSATHSFGGQGIIGGRAALQGTGNSLSALLGGGNGELKLFMSNGGDISAILVDLSGFQFGDAVLSALGIPRRAQLRCLVSDFVLQRGVLDTRTLLLDTSEANVTGKGSINLRNETLDYQIKTEAKHFTIGSLPAPINITGKLKDPSIRPDAVTLGARAGAAVGLGILLTPLGALLPTIQFGLGDDNNCGPLLASAQKAPDRAPVAR